MRQTTGIDSGQSGSALHDALLASGAAQNSGSSAAATSPGQSDLLSPQTGFGNRGSAPAERSSMAAVALVQETWAEILDLDAVGPDDDFFELGGNSLIVAAAVTRLGERLGIDLPMRALFEAPTPAEMAELIDDLGGVPARRPGDGISSVIADWVVPLQREGAGWPVFVFPAGHGGVRALTYEAQIAALVGRQHPFWGFRREHPHLEPSRQAGTPALAAEYVRQMRVIQPNGPFLLYATCAGGYLAWEAAKQLLAAGEKIAGILFYEVFLRPNFAELLKGSTPAHISPSLSLSLYYRPQALPVDLTLLMTEEWHARGWSEPWQRVARRSLEPIVIPGDPPGAQDIAARRRVALAAHVQAWIEQAEARVQGA